MVNARIVRWFFDPTIQDNRWWPMTQRTVFLEVDEMEGSERVSIYKRVGLYIVLGCVGVGIILLFI